VLRAVTGDLISSSTTRPQPSVQAWHSSHQCARTRLDVDTFGCSVTPPSGTVVDFVLGDVGSSISARDQSDLVLSLSCRGK